MPKAIEGRPYLKSWNVLYVQGFNDLSPARGHTESPQPLKFADIILYGKLSGISMPHKLLEFYRMISACDEAYLTYHEEHKPAKPAKEP